MEPLKYKELLKSNNLKITKARATILEILIGSPPLTIGEIYEKIRESGETVCLSMIYRNCETLVRKRLILKSNLNLDGIARYEYQESGSMHHAVCLRCNKIISISECHFDQLIQYMRLKYG